MGMPTGSKLNRLQRDLPEGLVVDANWLERGVFKRPQEQICCPWLAGAGRPRGLSPTDCAALQPPERDEPLRWQHVVISLQTVLERPFIVGGRTALELQGFAHYLGAGELREVHLYGNERPPAWISKLKLETKFVFHNARKLFKNEAPGHVGPSQQATGTRSRSDGLVRQPWGQWEWPLIFAPERAILELLDEVPQKETFHQADMLMEASISSEKANYAGCC